MTREEKAVKVAARKSAALKLAKRLDAAIDAVEDFNVACGQAGGKGFSLSFLDLMERMNEHAAWLRKMHDK